MPGLDLNTLQTGRNLVPAQSIRKYSVHLDSTTAWLLRSIRKKGSRAYFCPVLGWSKPYPETTGYIIPSLLNLGEFLDKPELTESAGRLGDWLVSIQLDNGAWPGGLYKKSGRRRPSVFNTGQIIKGLVALYRHTRQEKWLDAARKACHWLISGMGQEGTWMEHDYRASITPSYYSHVAWPLLEAWSEQGSERYYEAAVRLLTTIIQRRRGNGVFSGWGFDDSGWAFTHTIAYTIRGLLEAARLTKDWDSFGMPTLVALERLRRAAELGGGRLAGAFNLEWQAKRWYCCLTGNAQLAICFLILYERDADLRWVNAAAKLVDFVCSCQSLKSPIAGIRGGVAGSHPLYGKYMALRYPNWAAKYHCDALARLIEALGSQFPAVGSECDRDMSPY